jgi:hypothetical protein
MLAPAIMNLIRVFASEGHSGMSAAISLQIFSRLAQFKALTPLTNDPAEWHDVSDISGEPMWQNIRQSTCFSSDGGKTYYDIDEKDSPLHTAEEDAGNG